ncbi:MAG: NADH-quinone oxidoreductase subunit J [Bacteroidales bacterium]
MTAIIFWVLSAIVILSSIMVLLTRRPIYCLLYLLVAFFAMAGHFILLNAQFLATVYIIVYAGAIMVLFLFTLMLMNQTTEEHLSKSLKARVASVIAGGMLMVTLVGVLRDASIPLASGATISQVGLVKQIGQVLYKEYLLPFEVSSLLFLTSMVGAILLARKEMS